MNIVLIPGIVLELKIEKPIVAPISSMMETNVQVSYINAS